MMQTLQDMFSAIWSGFLAILVALGLAAPPAEPTFQGYAEGEFVLVAPTLGGTLETLSVQRGSEVAKSDPLFVLDSTNEAAARDQAAAMLQQAQDRLADLSKGKRRPEIDVIAAQKAQAEAQMQLAKIQAERQKRLAGSPAYSQEHADQARATYEELRARVQELTAQLNVAVMPQGRDDERRAAESDIAAAGAALTQAQWRLDQKTVTAPAAGLVAETYFRPGEVIAAGQAAVSILPPGNIKVRFFVPQAELARVPIGRMVTVRCDGCVDELSARVSFVAPEAEYTPPVLYNRDNRNRLVFMVEATPVAQPELLRPGQPLDVVPSEP